MSEKFVAQTLVETRLESARRRIELTFVDADGKRHTLSLPQVIAADLAPVLGSLAAAPNGAARAQFAKMPKALAVASAEQEQLVLVRFDDDPPYGLRPEEAETLWRGLRQEAAAVACAKVPMRQ